MKAPFGTATRSDVWFTLALAVIGIVGTVWQAIDRLLDVDRTVTFRSTSR